MHMSAAAGPVRLPRTERAALALRDDAVHGKDLRVLPADVDPVGAGDVPDVFGVGVLPVLLRGVLLEGRDLPLDVRALEREVGLVVEVEVVPGDLVAEDGRPLEGAEALG